MDISDDDEQIAALLRATRRVAVLGMKMEPEKPALYVPSYLIDVGLEVIPVPVYYPGVTEILGRKVYRKVADVPGPIDIVDVFRRSKDVAAHVADIVTAKPRCVWLQQGIRDDEAARKFSSAGILVVQDRCLMVDHERFALSADGR
jgi:predicted CoA-binding protein